MQKCVKLSGIFPTGKSVVTVLGDVWEGRSGFLLVRAVGKTCAASSLYR